MVRKGFLELTETQCGLVWVESYITKEPNRFAALKSNYCNRSLVFDNNDTFHVGYEALPNVQSVFYAYYFL